MERCDSTENSCPVCHDGIRIFAVGPCDHPVCYKCSTRMRVLCEQMDCPICRGPMPQVAFIYDKKLFKELNLRDCIPNRKSKIFYETEEIEDKYLDLLEFRCRQCPKRKPERTLAQLQTHMRRDHQLFACDICLAHLKIFPYETKFYDRKSLAVHRRMGDEDDKSYKGHPLCEFCDTRYLDKDELMKHLRKDHFFCHFCDQDGSNAYYNEYADLLQHFGESHFLCTEDECGSPSTRFTHAFSSEIDLKSHKATVHNRKSRETRTIDVDFQFAPRHQGYSRGSGINSDDYEDSGSQRHRNRGDRYGNRRRQHDDSNMQRAIEASLEENAEAKARPPVEERVPDPIHDFPTLGGTPVSSNVVDAQKSSTNSKKVEDFPSLGSLNGNSKKSQNVNNKNYAAITHFASEPRPVPKEKVKESQPVSLGTVKKAAKERWTVPTPKVTEEDYPSLVSNKKPVSRPASASSGNSISTWLQKPTVAEEPSSTSVAPSLSVIRSKPSDVDYQTKKSFPIMKPISDEKEFPSLGGGAARPESASMSNLWSKQKSSSSMKPSQKPKSEKVDETFELPDFYRSDEKSIQHLTNDKSKEEKSLKKSVVMNKKDFPDLPKREAGDKTQNKVKNDKVKDEVTGVNPQVGINVVKKTKKPKKSSRDKSLNDIAAGLIGASTVKPQAHEKKSKGPDENANHVKASKDVSKSKVSKTDWFDNPPIEVPKKPPNIESITETKLSSNNNFPSLHSMSSSVQRTNAPPGFTSNPFPTQTTNISAPPGFSSPAPPGLSKPTFSYDDYIQPADSATRNQVLVKSIRSCLETVEEGFDKFKTLSFQFRQGQINANVYYTNCLLLMGESDFQKIFPELLALLPDITKQQELWFEHQVVMSGRSSSKLQGNGKKLHPCAKCCQIVLKEDLQHHNLQHGDTQDFPSLGDTTSNGAPDYNANRPLKGAWIKAT